MKRALLALAVLSVATVSGAWAATVEGPVSRPEPLPAFLAIVVGQACTCPSVSCLTETGYSECVACAGCTCDARTDLCVAKKPTPVPVPDCPSSCMPETAYEACKACGGSCDIKTDACHPPAPTADKL